MEFGRNPLEIKRGCKTIQAMWGLRRNLLAPSYQGGANVIMTGKTAGWFIFLSLAGHTLLCGNETVTPDQMEIPMTARISLLHGRPMFLVNDRPVYPMIYSLTDVPGGRWSWEELPRHNIRAFYERGIRLFQVDVALEQLWQDNGTIDLAPAQKQIAGIREVCPEAGVIIRFHVTAPKWWMRAHPEEWVRYADTDYQDEDPNGFPRIIEDDNYPVRRVSLASELWKRESADLTREVLRLLAAAPEGNALVGVQVADGIYGEWHNWGFFRNEPDVGIPMTRAFRRWLSLKYPSDEALRVAWNDSSAARAMAEAPGVEERRTTTGVFRDPSRERKVIDFYTCMHEVIADRILFYAKLVKEAWPRPIVVGTFYGYFFSTFGRQAAGGHLELQRVLDSPFIDYLSGPQAYEPESMKPGEPYRSRSLITTILLHGKLWLDEMDNEPTIPIMRDARYELKLRNSIANVRRNLLFTYTKGMGLWFYDFGLAGVDLDGQRYNQRGSRGSWDDPFVLDEIGALKRLFEARSTNPYRTEADVLFVYDTRVFTATASLRGTDPVSSVCIDYNSLNAFKSGVVFDAIHLDDLGRIDLTSYRVVVFGNTFVLTDAQRRFIREKVAQDGRSCVWFYAPGYSNGERLDPGWISALTGIDVAPIASPDPPEIALSYRNDTLSTYTLGTGPITPLFAVTDPDAEILGRFAKTGEPAVARKLFSNFTSWFVTLPAKGIEPLREILRRSGAHVYSEQGDIVYAGGGILAVHTKTGGRHAVVLRNGNSLSFDLPEGGATLVLDSSTGELLRPVSVDLPQEGKQ